VSFRPIKYINPHDDIRLVKIVRKNRNRLLLKIIKVVNGRIDDNIENLIIGIRDFIINIFVE
jgi:hypothetical protein